MRAGRKFRATLLALALCASVGIHHVDGAPGDIYNLGTLGGFQSSAFGINDAGQMAGRSEPNTFNTTDRAFRYDGTPGSGGIMRDLGTLGGSDSYGRAINNLGQVTGHGYNNRSRIRAFLYDGTPGTGGIMHDLGTLGGNDSFGSDINDLGQVVGRSIITGGVFSHAFRYDGTPGNGGVMRDLGTLGGEESNALAINTSGQVAGQSNSADDLLRAFRYDGTPGSGGVMHDLGTLGGQTSAARGINDHGQVVGGSSTGAFMPGRAFRYDGTPGIDGIMLSLDTLGGEGDTAHAINNSAFVVGAAQLPEEGGDGFHPVLWRPDRSIVDLDVWLDTVNPSLGAHWTLVETNDINDAGFISGYGMYDDGPAGLSDGERAFLLDASALVSSFLHGDFDYDGQYTAADIDLLIDAINGGGPAIPYDVSADNQMTLADLRYEVETLIGTKFGDTDLDLDVDLDDLANLASGYGQPDGTWATGDTDGDGDVDLADLTRLATHYDGGQAQAMADFAAMTAVPEPASASAALLLGAAMCLTRHRRERVSSELE